MKIYVEFDAIKKEEIESRLAEEMRKVRVLGRRLRKDKKIFYRDLEVVSGVSRPQLMRLENGQMKNITLRTLVALSLTYKIELVDFFKEINE